MRPGFIPSTAAFLVVIALGAASGAACKTARPSQAAVTYPFEPGVGACRAAIETPETTGLVRYVGEGEKVREVWDTDGDGSAERELLKVRDADGRVIRIDQFDASGTLVQRIEREYDGDRLVAERGDQFDTEGQAGPDGKPDWIRQLEWKEGALVAEYLDETDEEGLPGIDGDPEFVTTWTPENGRRSSGEKRHQGLIVASFELEWAGEKLEKETADWGDDGTVDEKTTYEYDAKGRVRVMEHEARGGGYTATYTYECDE